MAKASRTTSSLPEEIVVWEILVRLPPKPLLHCRSACRAWRRVTCTRDFLLAHHGRQPNFPLLSGDDRYTLVVHNHNILGVHTDDEQLHTVAQFDDVFCIKASCDGLLILSNLDVFGYSPRLSVCNPATREHAPLGLLPWDFDILGMYWHHPTGEYRLLLQRRRFRLADQGTQDQMGCYVFALSSDVQTRYIGWPEMMSGLFNKLVRVRENLHWYPVYDLSVILCETKRIVVFDTIAESFRLMHAPVAPTDCYIFKMEGTLGIYSSDYAMENIDIWVLQNYESEIWDLKYRIKLPTAQIKRDFEDRGDRWDLNVVSVDGGVLLLVKVDGWLLHVDNDGKVVKSFYGFRCLCMSGCRLKQSLVQHTFFPALKGYAVNAPPFIGPIE